VVRIVSRRDPSVTTDASRGPPPLYSKSASDLELRQEAYGLTSNVNPSPGVTEGGRGYDVYIWWLNLKLSFRCDGVFGVVFIYAFHCTLFWHLYSFINKQILYRYVAISFCLYVL
jgi:hypothetical protein